MTRMGTVEIEIDDSLLAEVDYLAEEEFTNRKEAVEKILAAGIKTYTRDVEDSFEDLYVEEYVDMWDSETDTW